MILCHASGLGSFKAKVTGSDNSFSTCFYYRLRKYIYAPKKKKEKLTAKDLVIFLNSSVRALVDA